MCDFRASVTGEHDQSDYVSNSIAMLVSVNTMIMVIVVTVVSVVWLWRTVVGNHGGDCKVIPITTTTTVIRMAITSMTVGVVDSVNRANHVYGRGYHQTGYLQQQWY